MFDNLNLRNKFLAVAAVPMGFLVVAAVLAAMAGEVIVAALAGVGAVAAIAVAFVAASAVTTKVDDLIHQVDQLTETRLPKVLARLTDGEVPGGVVGDEADDGDAGSADHRAESADEFDRLGAALASIETATQESVAAQRATTSERLRELIKNLARRSQSLLDRQINHIDWLEATEESPERLEQLFKLDHLATRMRRTSESILVLGGVEPVRRRGQPSPISDVIRVGMAENEDYRNIKLRSFEPAMMTTGPAFTLAHILSELLQNATQFSPPDTITEIHATALNDGSYQIAIIDRGVGMTDLQLDASNKVLADPPEIDLSLGHSLGFIVVGHLAKSIGATVELMASGESGVTANVVIPADVISLGSDAAQTPVLAPAPSTPGSHEEPRQKRRRPMATDSPTGGAPTTPRADSQPSAMPSRPSSPATPRAVPEPAWLNQADSEPSAEKPERRKSNLPTRPTESGKPKAPSGPNAETSTALSKLLGLDASPDLMPPGGAATPSTGNTEPVELDTPETVPTRNGADVAESTDGGQDEETDQSASLDEALPTGAAFDSGVDGLLTEPGETEPAADVGRDTADTSTVDSTETGTVEDESTGETQSDGEETWTPPTVSAAAPVGSGAGLARRDKGASDIPTSTGPRVAVSTRKPEEARSMITRYRDGLKGNNAATEPGNTATQAESRATQAESRATEPESKATQAESKATEPEEGDK